MTKIIAQLECLTAQQIDSPKINKRERGGVGERHRARLEEELAE